MRADFRPRRRTLRASCLVALAVVAGNASSLPGRRMLGQYDFGYAIRGDRPARPAQVFDDGAGKVYFEMRPGQAMPAVFVGKAPALLITTAEGQYFTARTAESEFTLALGAARASVRRGDAALGAESITPDDDGRADRGRLLASADAGLPAAVRFGESPSLAAGASPLVDDAPRTVSHEQPIVFGAGSATLRAEVLDALTALVVRVGRDTPIQAIGRNDAGAHDALAQRRSEALRNALLARGVPARNIDTAVDETGQVDGAASLRASSLRWRTTVAGSAAVPVFDIRVADRDIAVTLRRWARASGYDIAWDVRWAAPVTGEMRLDALTFMDALGQVVAGLRAQGYPVQAQAGPDHVVRFRETP
jgi:outer membrane protein OmpA-like peptidoglycan-associated protein